MFADNQRILIRFSIRGEAVKSTCPHGSEQIVYIILEFQEVYKFLEFFSVFLSMSDFFVFSMRKNV